MLTHSTFSKMFSALVSFTYASAALLASGCSADVEDDDIEQTEAALQALQPSITPAVSRAQCKRRKGTVSPEPESLSRACKAKHYGGDLCLLRTSAVDASKCMSSTLPSAAINPCVTEVRCIRD